MRWVVGIDEAGHGPNLGPLVQAAAAVRLPDDDPTGWDALRPVVRKSGRGAKDLRLVVDDSKRVYSGVNALEKLERNTRGLFGLVAPTVGELLSAVTLEWCLTELTGEGWYDATALAPIATTAEAVRKHVDHFTAHCPAGITVAAPCAVVTPAPRFNTVVEASGTKATLLAHGLIDLLRVMMATLPGEESVIVLCDKQGGRNYYAPLLQEAFPTAGVFPQLETNSESRYVLEGLGRVVTVTFRPKADGDSIAVAAASMVCKYLREVCMGQFNAFWAKHVPGLKETAGYPVDAKRFFDDIRPAMAKLGIAERAVWRMK
jgi:sorbitol-specific phosphotransferase system component IIC